MNGMNVKGISILNKKLKNLQIIHGLLILVNLKKTGQNYLVKQMNNMSYQKRYTNVYLDCK